MEYMYDLRQLAGSRPLLMVGSTLLALDNENRLLMMRRTDNKFWGVPGGAMELGESFEDTVKRETKEEIGIEINELELFGNYSGSNFFYQYPNGDQVFIVSAVYITRNIKGEIKLNLEEHSEYKFFEIHNLPNEISPVIKPILEDFLQFVSHQDSR